MCELLVKAVDASSVDPNIDAGCFKLGMPVVIAPDGWQWGAQETLPKFWQIQITDRTVDQALLFAAQWTDANGSIVKVREWVLDWTNLPSQIKNALTSTGRWSGKYTQIKGYIKSLKTGATAP